jgi:hypothetical protein
VIVDPFGRSWSIATPIRDMSLEEIQQDMLTYTPSGSCGSAQA